ncbi:hypothetical protein BC831DRAFT_475333 [Entophlyctis helioformis]|nr:hypothetical protein BC831DRAFT_475333 [Entophlyctis helioformis]
MARPARLLRAACWALCLAGCWALCLAGPAARAARATGSAGTPSGHAPLLTVFADTPLASLSHSPHLTIDAETAVYTARLPLAALAGDAHPDPSAHGLAARPPLLQTLDAQIELVFDLSAARPSLQVVVSSPSLASLQPTKLATATAAASSNATLLLQALEMYACRLATIILLGSDACDSLADANMPASSPPAFRTSIVQPDGLAYKLASWPKRSHLDLDVLNHHIHTHLADLGYSGSWMPLEQATALIHITAGSPTPTPSVLLSALLHPRQKPIVFGPSQQASATTRGGTVTVVAPDSITDWTLPIVHRPAGEPLVPSVSRAPCRTPAPPPLDLLASIEPTFGYHSKLTVRVGKQSGACGSSEASDILVVLHLSSDAFADRFELGRMDFGPHIRVAALGDADLEVPSNSPVARDNLVLIHFAHSCSLPTDLSVEIPFHLRYQPATATRDRARPIRVSFPTAFWVKPNSADDKLQHCPAVLRQKSAPLLSSMDLPALFSIAGNSTLIPIPVSSKAAFAEFSIPLGSVADYDWVPAADAIIVIAGVAVVIWVSLAHRSQTFAGQKFKQE